MSASFIHFIICLFLANYLRKYVKVNSLPQWEKLFKNALIFAAILFASDVILSSVYITKWIWHIFLIALIVFPLKQKEFRPLRMFIVAFVPFAFVSFFSDLIQIISTGFYKNYGSFFSSATTLTYIWMVAILFSQNRQRKTAEKERIKRQREDELNRAIAIRKVELEALVAERTTELTKQKDELEHTLDELRATQTQLIQAEKMASLGELTAGIAHEIQNPLNFVNNFSEVSNELLNEMNSELEKGDIDEAKAIAADVKQNLEKINHHGKRAADIVKGMLQHSRTSSGQKEPTDINVLADEYLRLSYHGLRAKDKSFNATLKTDFDESIGKINVVPQEIGRVILNLINNAFYAVNEKKQLNIPGYEPIVSVSTSRSLSSGDGRDEVLIKVTDNGNGIPRKVLDKIFQPFFTTKPTGQGTGLGLSLSYDIITKGHGGELKVKTKEGEGTEFIIQLISR